MGKIVSKNEKINGLKFIELHNKRPALIVKAVRVDKVTVMLTKKGKLICNMMTQKSLVRPQHGNKWFIPDLLKGCVQMSVIKQSDMDEHMAGYELYEKASRLRDHLYKLDRIQSETGLKFTQPRKILEKQLAKAKAKAAE